MTELTVSDSRTSTCPPWCVADAEDGAAHTHSSADVRVETLGHPLSVQLVQVAGAEARMLIDGQVTTLEQGLRFAYAIKKLTDAGTLASPGLAFVVQLASGSGITLEEMALASGIDVERLRSQRSGGQVLTVDEVDRLALTVANLAATRKDS